MTNALLQTPPSSSLATRSSARSSKPASSSNPTSPVSRRLFPTPACPWSSSAATRRRSNPPSAMPWPSSKSRTLNPMTSRRRSWLSSDWSPRPWPPAKKLSLFNSSNQNYGMNRISLSFGQRHDFMWEIKNGTIFYPLHSYLPNETFKNLKKSCFLFLRFGGYIHTGALCSGFIIKSLLYFPWDGAISYGAKRDSMRKAFCWEKGEIS